MPRNDRVGCYREIIPRRQLLSGGDKLYLDQENSSLVSKAGRHVTSKATATYQNMTLIERICLSHFSFSYAYRLELPSQAPLQILL